MHPKDADGMANSVDPDQTASSETYLSQYIEFVRYILQEPATTDCTEMAAWPRDAELGYELDYKPLGSEEVNKF